MPTAALVPAPRVRIRLIGSRCWQPGLHYPMEALPFKEAPNWVSPANRTGVQNQPRRWKYHSRPTTTAIITPQTIG